MRSLENAFNKKGSELESKEGLKQEPSLFFIRHGESSYEGEGLDLTSKGVEQMTELSQNLMQKLSKENDLIFCVSSEKARSIYSKEIVKKELETNNFSVRSLTKDTRAEISGMRGRTLDGQNLDTEGDDYNALFDRLFPEDMSEEEQQDKLKLWVENADHELATAIGKTNKYSEVSSEVEYIINLTKRITVYYSKRIPKGKRVVVLFFTHGEVIDVIDQNSSISKTGREVENAGFREL